MPEVKTQPQSPSLQRQIARQVNPAFRTTSVDPGAVNTFFNSARLNFDLSFGNSIVRNVQAEWADYLDNKNGVPPLEKSEFEQKYSLDGTLEWREGVSRTRAKLEAEWKMKELWNEHYLDAGRDHFLSSLAGGFVGSMTHPIDIATMMFTPGVGVGAQTAKLAATKGIANAAKAQTLTRYVLAGSTAGAIDGAWQAPLMLGLNQNIQANYSEADATLDFLMSPVFGGLLGGLSFSARRTFAGVDIEETIKNENDGAMLAATIAAEQTNALNISKLRRLNELSRKSRDMEPDEWAELRELQNDPTWTDGTPMPRAVTKVLERSYHTIEAKTWEQAEAASRPAQSPEEVTISELMSNLFGTTVKFTQFTDELGMTYGRNADTIYISPDIDRTHVGEKELSRPISLTQVVGHEFAHSLRLRDPDLFSEMMKVISSDSRFVDIFNEAMVDIGNIYGEKDWNSLSPARKLDEGAAQTMARVFEEPKFWQSAEVSKDLKQRIASMLRHMLNEIKTMLSRIAPGKPKPRGMEELAEKLGTMLGHADLEGLKADSRWFTENRKKFSTDLFTALTEARTRRKDQLNARDLEERALDRMARIGQGSDLWFGVPLRQWVDNSVLRVVNEETFDKPETIKNPFGYMVNSKGIPVFYYKGERVEWNRSSKNIKVDKIEVYNASDVRVRGIEADILDTRNQSGESGFEQQLPSPYVIKNTPEKIDSVQNNIKNYSSEQWADVVADLFSPMQKGLWAEQLHQRLVRERKAKQKEVNNELHMLRHQVRAMVGDFVVFDVDGETHNLRIDELTDGQLFAAWTSIGSDMARAAGMEPLTIFPFDQTRSVRAQAKGEEFFSGIPANPESTGVKATIGRLRQLLSDSEKGGHDIDKVNMIRELAESYKMLQDLHRLSGSEQDISIGLEHRHGLSSEDYGEAMKALDKYLDGPDNDFFDAMALPKPKDFKEGFGQYVENIKDFTQKVRNKRKEAAYTEALEGERAAKQRAERVMTDNDRAKAVEDLRKETMSEEVLEVLDIMERDVTDESVARRKELMESFNDRDLYLFSNYQSIQNKFKEYRSTVENAEYLGKGEANIDLDAVKLPPRVRQILRPIVKTKGKTTLQEMENALDAEQRYQEFTLFNDFSIRTKMMDDAIASKNPLKYISTRLDGLFRSEEGADLAAVQSSIDAQAHARASEDMNTLANILDQENLIDEFMNDNMVADVMLWLETNGEADVPPQVARVAQHIQNIYKAQVNEMARAGGDVKWLDGFSLSQIWDMARVKDVSFEEFRAVLIEHLDWNKIQKYHEKPLTDPDSYLRDVYDDMVEGRYRELHTVDMESFGGNIAKQVSHHRSMFFKPGGTFAAMSKFGRGSSVGMMVFNQIRKNSERTVMLENFGSNYKDTFNIVMENSKAREFVSKTESEGAVKKVKDTVGEFIHSFDYQTTKATFDKLTGDLDNPLYQKIADIGITTRRLSNLANLWQSGISALNDVPSIVAALKYAGVDIGITDKRFWSAVKQGYKAKNNKRTRMWLQANGAALQSTLNNLSARVALGETSGIPGKVGKANDWMFSMNGLSLITDVGQAVHLDLMTLHLGSGEISGDMLRALSRHGIGIEELKDARKSYARKVEGYSGQRLSPDMFEVDNPDLARKFRNFLEDSMRQAVIEPGVREQTIARGGLKAGTLPGETMRFAAQYTTFPLAITMKTLGRLYNGYGEANFNGLMSSGKNRAMIHTLSFAASGFVLGYMITVIKDILKGREPIHLGNMNSANFKRIVDVSGIAGIMGPIMEGDIPTSPAFTQLADLTKDILSGDATSYKMVTTGMGLLPGATIPVAGWGQDSVRGLFSLMVGDGMGMNYETHYQNRLAWIEQEFGQSSIFGRDNKFDNDFDQ